MQSVLENSTVLTIIIIITLSHNSPHFKTNTIHIQSNEAAAAVSCWTPIEACQYIYADILNAASIFVWIPPEVAEWAESWRFGLRPCIPHAEMALGKSQGVQIAPWKQSRKWLLMSREQRCATAPASGHIYGVCGESDEESVDLIGAGHMWHTHSA